MRRRAARSRLVAQLVSPARLRGRRAIHRVRRDGPRSMLRWAPGRWRWDAPIAILRPAPPEGRER